MLFLHLLRSAIVIQQFCDNIHTLQPFDLQINECVNSIKMYISVVFMLIPPTTIEYVYLSIMKDFPNFRLWSIHKGTGQITPKREHENLLFFLNVRLDIFVQISIKVCKS